MDPVSCELLSVGSELLVGETVDTNAAYIGAELALLGLVARGVRQVPDDRPVIAEAVRDARSRSALVITTGGLGPTHDDLTREATADALGEELAEDPALIAALERRFRSYGPMPSANRKQATVIPSAVPLDNPIGSAPGWWVDLDDRVVVLLPGVPAEMRRMWREQVVPRIRNRFSLPTLHVRVVKTFGVGESALAGRLAELLDMDDPWAGIYARDDGVHVRFTTRGDPARLEDAISRTLALTGGDAYGTDQEELPAVALAALARRGVGTVATWEADTAGALLAILAGVTPADGLARFVGGLLDAGGIAAVPHADAVLQVALSPAARTGRSEVEV
ncbi:MAG: molybdopterin-binding protein, partial [Chloroflexota bacterium]|nr:molybdopterin-binding protein [Chloroflexota bacterium]